MKNLVIAVVWATWAVAGGHWLRLGQPADGVADYLAALVLAAAHGVCVGFLTAQWQFWRERRRRST